MDELIDEVRSRGYWQVVIHTPDHEPRRVPNILDLRTIAVNCSVRLRGWDFPHVEGLAENSRILENYIEARTSWQHYREVWRLYQSGQFTFLGGIWNDWTDVSSLWSYETTWPDAPIVGVGDLFITLWEIYEFASRLIQTEAGGEEAAIRVRLGNMKGRALWMDAPRRSPFFRPYVFQADKWEHEEVVTAAELLAGSRDRALDPALDLIRRFGWDPGRERLLSFAEGLGD